MAKRELEPEEQIRALKDENRRLKGLVGEAEKTAGQLFIPSNEGPEQARKRAVEANGNSWTTAKDRVRSERETKERAKVARHLAAAQTDRALRALDDAVEGRQAAPVAPVTAPPAPPAPHAADAPSAKAAPAGTGK